MPQDRYRTAVPPTGCDEVTAEIKHAFKDSLSAADAVLVMSCAFGVQTAASQTQKPVVPALDTLFMGKEGPTGRYSEICMHAAVRGRPHGEFAL